MVTLRLFAFLLPLALCGVASGVAAERPNIVFILADDLTFRDLGCYGGQAYTPNIDLLAQGGLRFTRCFQAAPMCSPTRHNLYTGLHPVRSGAYPNHAFAKAGTKSIAHYLKRLGYRVALSGKKHIGPRKVFPFEYSGGKNPNLDRIAELFAECAESDVPFCLFACSNEPHSPWNKGDLSRYPAKEILLPPYIAETPVIRQAFGRYLAEVTYFDDQVGQIVALLDQYKLRENTLVMVASEQGNGFPFAKWTCYGHGLQSALIANWPGKIKAGETDAMVEYVDVTPTLVETAGGKPAAGLDGKSFLSVLRGKVSIHKHFTYGMMTTRGILNGSDAYAVRTVRGARYRLIWNLNYETRFTNACTQSGHFRSMVAAAKAGDAKAADLAHRYQNRPQYELYDCVADPWEMRNVASDPRFAHVVREHKEKLETWMASQGDRGVEMELDALLHQGRFRGLTRAQADQAWRKRRVQSRRKKKS